MANKNKDFRRITKEVDIAVQLNPKDEARTTNCLERLNMETNGGLA